ESQWEGQDACIASLRDITERKQAEKAARQLASEQAARATAENAARRLRFLADSSAVLASSLDYGTTLAAVAKLCVQELADWTVVYTVDQAGAIRRLEVAHRDSAKTEEVRSIRNVPIDPQGTSPV